MEERKFAVISTYTFDAETHVYLFDTEQEAIDFLQEYWQWSYNCEIGNEDFDEENSYHEDDYAVVKWKDNSSRIFQLVEVENKKEFR